MTSKVPMYEDCMLVGGTTPDTIGLYVGQWSGTLSFDFESKTNYATQVQMFCNIGESEATSNGGDCNITVRIEVDKEGSGSWETWEAKTTQFVFVEQSDGTAVMIGESVAINITAEEFRAAYPSSTYPNAVFRGKATAPIYDAGPPEIPGFDGGWMLINWIVLASGFKYGISAETNAEIKAATPKTWCSSVNASSTIADASIEFFCTPDGS